MSAVILTVNRLSRHFGGVVAVDRLDISVQEGSIHGLIGPNGSGKTTVFNCVSGFYRPTGGRVVFRGRDITGLSSARIARLGLGRTFQNPRLFSSMTVLDNVLVSLEHRSQATAVDLLLRPRRYMAAQVALRRRAGELLEFVGIAGYAHQAVATLPYGIKRLAEVARVLALQPCLLLLDEPAAGLNSAETLRLRELLLQIRARGITLFMVEHDMKLVMDTCDVVTVLNFGRRIAQGTPAEASRDPRVLEAYLGRGAQGA